MFPEERKKRELRSLLADSNRRDVPADAERELAELIAKRAMIQGWDKAVQWAVREYDVSDLRIKDLLDRVEAYNEKADPQGRIEELTDWKIEKRGRSERASGFSIRSAPRSKSLP